MRKVRFTVEKRLLVNQQSCFLFFLGRPVSSAHVTEFYPLKCESEAFPLAVIHCSLIYWWILTSRATLKPSSAWVCNQLLGIEEPLSPLLSLIRNTYLIYIARNFQYLMSLRFGDFSFTVSRIAQLKYLRKIRN